MISFTVHPQHSNAVIVKTPASMIGGPDALEFNELIRDMSQQYSVILLDMSETSIMNSSGLGMLVSAHTTLKKLGKHCTLYCVPDTVMSLLSMTRLDSIFDIAATLESAI